MTGPDWNPERDGAAPSACPRPDAPPPPTVAQRRPPPPQQPPPPPPPTAQQGGVGPPPEWGTGQAVPPPSPSATSPASPVGSQAAAQRGPTRGWGEIYWDPRFQIARVWWMVTWRCAVVASLPGLLPLGRGGSTFSLGPTLTLSLLVALPVAVVLVVVFKRTLSLFPVAALAMNWFTRSADKGHKRSLRDRPRDDRGVLRPEWETRYDAAEGTKFRVFVPLAKPVRPDVRPPPRFEEVDLLTRPRVTKASHRGRATGYEPDVLQSRPFPQSPLMHGIPGKSLTRADFDLRSVELGVAGEVGFAKALDAAGLLGRFPTFWSLGMPDANGQIDREFSSDIDAAIWTASGVWLIDLKFYPQGDVEYASYDRRLYCVDRTTGSLVGDPREMSQNMRLAADRFRRLSAFRRTNVTPIVVFMPTPNGLGDVSQVYWPGVVKAMPLDDVLNAFQAHQSPPPHEFGRIGAQLARLRTT